MKKLAFSNSLKVAERRYIQSIHEQSERRNPDTLVGMFLPLMRRWRCQWLRRRTVTGLQADPIYYYLLARTRYYDEVFLRAIDADVRYIINVGCGTDTRAYRFKEALNQNGVEVVECDQPVAISIKQDLAKRVGSHERLRYVAIDLNNDAWSSFEACLSKIGTAKALVFMEGVAPYINTRTFEKFLALLGTNLSKGSRVAYDFKLRGFDEEAVGVEGAPKLFRLGGERKELTVFHEQFGYRLAHMEGSADLTLRTVEGLSRSKSPLFIEDMLVQLEVLD
mgnify:CR=1 FL=1